MEIEEVKTPLDLAREEIKTWLDYKKVPAKRREELKDNIEKIAEFLIDKNVVLDQSKMVFTQKLLFPIGDIDTLTYKPRLKQLEIGKRIQGLKANDNAAFLRAYICALTDKPADLIANLDTEDYTFGQALAVFFA